ncbi:MAG: amidohydrolase family protein, partial [Betaproteobacteria bacterium]
MLPISGPPLRCGRVAVAGGRIAWVGRAGDAGEPRAPLRDLGPGVLLPGLVNAHCHLELSHLAGRVPFGGGFVAWIEALVAERGRSSPLAAAGGTAAPPAAEPDEARAATLRAIRFLEERGTVAVGDVSNALAHLDALAGSRLDAVVFAELLAWDPVRADATLAWGEERRRAVASLVRPGLDVRLAAHAPHSVSPALLRLLVERGGPAAIHLAESRDEARFLCDGGGPWRGFLERRGLGHVAFEPPGVGPVRYLEQAGALHPRLVAVHCVQVDAADRERLARHGVHVVLCPRSNRSLGVGQADAPALLASGVRLALGTDSLASAETLDVLDDAVLLHRQFPALEPAAIVRMATLGGALALGLDGLGALAPGKRAALAFAAAAAGPDDPHAHLLSGEARLSRVEV